MTQYRVVWEIDIEADSPREAAGEARYIQLDADSYALHFDVISDDGTVHHIDLNEDEDDEQLTCDTCGRVGSRDDGIEPGGPCQEPCDGTVRRVHDRAGD